nr:hypothetical protein [Tanacetum cinerariifolium]
MFTQEEQYTDLLEPIPEPQLGPQNDNHVTSVAQSMVHNGGTVETSSAPNEEIRTHQETVYRNLVDQVAQLEVELLLLLLSNEQLSLKISNILSPWPDCVGPSNMTQSSAVVAPGLITNSNTLSPSSNNITSSTL